MAIVTLEEAKSKLLGLTNIITCNEIVLKDCYQVGETVYSIVYKQDENKYYTIDPNDQSLVEV